MEGLTSDLVEYGQGNAGRLVGVMFKVMVSTSHARKRRLVMTGRSK